MWNYNALSLMIIATMATAHAASGGDELGLNANTTSHASGHKPLVYLAVLARNAGHLLHTYFGYIERLDYPKNRIIIGIFTDPSVDNTVDLLKGWADKARPYYHSVIMNEGDKVIGEEEMFVWTKQRLEYMTHLRQKPLEQARELHSDYIFFVDCDNFLINPQVLNRLIEAKKPIVAPLLIVMKDAAYSNFWGGQNENGYYVRTQEYISILKGKKQGCFKVPVVHSTFLIDLRTKASEGLAYWPPPDNYKWDIDDIIIFSFSARKSGMGMYVLTTEFFGYLKMPGEYSSLAEAINQAVNWKLKTIVNHVPIPASEFITRDSSTPTDTVGMDKVYLISLERRPERRQRMFACLNELEINFELFNAIDGKQLNQSYLDELGIHYLPGWKDPWGERPMTFGEVGCFLSHYFIWLKMIAEEINTVLILEDDVDFEPNFKQNVLHTLEEVKRVNSNWDLVYVGRKPLVPDSEVIIPNTTNLVIPSYSYWTLGYIISLRGARKLVTARPLDNLLPVDEFIPIMFNRHTETEWVNFFSNRNLEAYSVNPLIIFPTHYVGDPEWFSDTEPPPHILEQIRLRKVAEQEKAAIDTNGNDMKDEL